MTAVQPVHLARIGSLEAIEAAKGELLEALPPDGTAVLNADDPIVRRMGRRSVARNIATGSPLMRTWRPSRSNRPGMDGMRFVLRTDGARFSR